MSASASTAVLQALDLLDSLDEIADIARDSVGRARSKVRSSDTVVFEYAPAWLAHPDRFAPLA